MPPRARDADMVELRTLVARLREQNASFRDRMERVKEEIRPQAEAAKQDRERAMEELREAYRKGEVPTEDRELVRRVMDGETTWRAVFTGEDDAPTAVSYRERFRQQFSAGVEQLRDDDDEFATWLGEVQRRTSASVKEDRE